ncbi:sigma-70 family RNA polymerase sigma factor [Chitinophaga sancti]|uniref:RNA polymerase sigma-70 factor, ECF subfamily n=1 Tax=Chitinophaga sancti TaxID=1004 RepID=A0A1K1M3R2_9BACT|nr:sigma-70 family RNA polymerase sigma factor [Chitinophaga sancti]WQD64655.1 sigma-70 family RNA polymerase sigma factor [Chitinophaga sancti]WQG89723.1 sigma-70 family RNA polymerase sigma factor [Chitinophaga sancti]SFW17781.1 RNA polymerase sigma-70 factor, ECF subfamily [Chitinophaga sancti]
MTWYGTEISAATATEGLRDRNMEVFKHLYLTYSEDLFLLAYRWVKDESLAKDLVHNLFVHLWEKGASLTITGNVRHYLFRAVTNRAINELKRQSRHVSEDILQWQADPASLYETADYILLQKEIIHLVQGLAPRCKEIFLLSRVQGLEPSEIAEKLNITLNTVYFQLSVALKHLRLHLLGEKKTGK